MPRRRALQPIDAAQEERDIAEHEVGQCLEAMRWHWERRDTRSLNEAREQFEFWAGEYHRAELAFQKLMANQQEA